MSAVATEVKDEYRQVKDDEPGHRFEHHRERMKRKPTWFAAVRLVLGLVLVGGGVVLLFIPGPGLLAIVFGLALLAGMSTRAARVMDRIEPELRHCAQWMRRHWLHIGGAAKAAVVLVALAVVALVGYALVRLFI